MEFIAPFVSDTVPLDEHTDSVIKSPVISIHSRRLELSRLAHDVPIVCQKKSSLRTFLMDAALKECVDVKKRDNANDRKQLSCGCMLALGPIMSEAEVMSAVDYLFGFGLLSKSEQQTLVKEWIK